MTSSVAVQRSVQTVLLSPLLQNTQSSAGNIDLNEMMTDCFHASVAAAKVDWATHFPFLSP